MMMMPPSIDRSNPDTDGNDSDDNDGYHSSDTDGKRALHVIR